MTRQRSRFLDPDLFPEKPWFTRKRAILRKMRLLGGLLYITGAMRMHLDGDGLSAVWRWWHPVSWLVLLCALPVCAFTEGSVVDVMQFRPSPYWRDPAHRALLEWV